MDFILALLQSNYTTYIILGVFLVLIIVMSIINNKKRKEQANKEAERKSKLCAGTKIITIGGIKGVVVSVDDADDSFILETEGANIKFDKRAIYQMTLPDESTTENDNQ